VFHEWRFFPHPPARFPASSGYFDMMNPSGGVLSFNFLPCGSEPFLFPQSYLFVATLNYRATCFPVSFRKPALLVGNAPTAFFAFGSFSAPSSKLIFLRILVLTVPSLNRLTFVFPPLAWLSPSSF